MYIISHSRAARDCNWSHAAVRAAAPAVESRQRRNNSRIPPNEP